MNRLTIAYAAAGLLCVASLTACADRDGTSPAARSGTLAPPEQIEEPLLELSYEGGLIANPDPTPFVRVFPDGRVLVHYPSYMKRAGDYELRLDPEELEQLLASFSNEGVLMLDKGEMLSMRAGLREQLPEPRADDHGLESVVRIRGESFTPRGEEQPVMFGIDNTIRAPSDLLSAAPESGFSNLQSLATGVRSLEDLARSEELRKIEE